MAKKKKTAKKKVVKIEAKKMAKKRPKAASGPSSVAPSVTTPPAKKQHFCIPFPGKQEISQEFAEDVKKLESQLGMPVWLLVQAGHRNASVDGISATAKQILFEARFMPGGLERGKPVALLIDSPGGQARSAYEIATLFQKHCGGFTAVVPRRAKSAATLVSLGADDIILGEYGELGPLDVQMLDEEREEWISGLDEVLAL